MSARSRRSPARQLQAGLLRGLGMFLLEGLVIVVGLGLLSIYLQPNSAPHNVAGQESATDAMPTDALVGLRDAMVETRAMGFDAAKQAQCALGKGARALLAAYGHKPLAAEGFGAPGVVVCFTDRPELHNGTAFAAAGYQIAAGVPLMVGEGDSFRTFRIGLFGLDKLKDVPGTLARLDSALKAVAS